MLKKEKSEALSKKYNEYYPGGHSNLRVPMDVTKHKLFIDTSIGTHLTDIDGNEYIEYNGSMGPNILGHAHPEFVQILTDYMKTHGTAIGSNLLFSPLDIEVAELLRKYLPCAEEVKFTSSGTECVKMAYRIMRAYTGKPRILRLEGHYGGWADEILGGWMKPDEEGRPCVSFEDRGLSADEDPYQTHGRAPHCEDGIFMIPYNDFDAMEETFEKWHDEIAGVHFEGINWDHDGLYPKPGYLERMRELCDKYNVVMSMDEIITGFRLGLGGAQTELGVTPDICTLGKAMANGIPTACVAGKKKIMDCIRDGYVLCPGTYPGYGLGQCATKATIEILAKDNGAVYKQVWNLQEQLMDGMIACAEKYDIPLTITESQGVFSTIFGIPGGRRRLYTKEDLVGFDKKIVEVFQQYLQEYGVFIMFGGRWYVNASHSQEDIDKTLVAIDKAMKAMKENDMKYVSE